MNGQCEKAVSPDVSLKLVEGRRSQDCHLCRWNLPLKKLSGKGFTTCIGGISSTTLSRKGFITSVVGICPRKLVWERVRHLCRWNQLHKVVGEHSSPSVHLSAPPADVFQLSFQHRDDITDLERQLVRVLRSIRVDHPRTVYNIAAATS